MRAVIIAVLIVGISSNAFAQAMVAPPPAEAVSPSNATQQSVPSKLGGTSSTEGSGRDIANKSFHNGGQRLKTTVPYSVGVPSN